MDRRPRADRRAPAAGAVIPGALAGALVAAVVGLGGSPRAQAQPAATPSEADLERARDLYQTAEAEQTDGRYEDAVRDYGASYELSRDPALLFKIGRAHERAGQCDVALGFYARYLREGKPTEPFVETTNERIAACGGKLEKPGIGSAGTASDSAERASGLAGSASGSSAGSATGSTTTTGSISGAASGAGDVALPRLSNQRKAAWIITGSALGLVTLGSVLAYAARSSENDVRDLYAGFGNIPPTFDSSTRKNYNDLVDQGRRYQHLAWAAFGAAGAASVGAALLFWLDDHPSERTPSEAPRIAPVVSPHSAGVSVRF